MSGWGVSVAGSSRAIRLLRQLSINFDDGVVYVVGPTVEYAVYVDQGTSRMEARPFARPAAETVQANLDRYLQDVPEYSEDAILRQVALGVESEMKRIITVKEAVDTGAMRASVTVERVK